MPPPTGHIIAQPWERPGPLHGSALTSQRQRAEWAAAAAAVVSAQSRENIPAGWADCNQEGK